MIHVTATELPRVMNCNGYVFMKPAPYTIDTDARDEGNAAHYAAQMIFQGAGPDTLINTPAFNGYVITSDMIRHVSDYVSALDCGSMEVELNYIGQGYSVTGRADHLKYHDTPDALTIDEFKYGHRLIEPENNWTLISHAVAWCVAHDHWPQSVFLRIHQPRPYHEDGPLRTWELSGTALYALYMHLDTTLNNLQNTLQTGPWCHKCHANATCPAARSASMNSIDASSDRFDDSITNEVLSVELIDLETAQATIKSRLDALHELAKHRIKIGQIVPNYGLKTTFGHRKWKYGLGGNALTAITGVNACEPSDDAVTPAELERRGVPRAVIDRLTEQPPIGTKLTRIDVQKEARRLTKGKT